MGRVLLPPRVEREIQKHQWVQQRAEQKARVVEAMDFDDAVCKEWQPELAKLDRRLTIGKAKPAANLPEFDVRAGFYHIICFNESAPISVLPFTDVDGESYAEPDSRLLNDLRSNDLQNPTVWGERIGRRAKREAHAAHQKAQERERRVDEVLGRYKAGTSPGVLMTPGWTRSVDGRRGKSQSESQSQSQNHTPEVVKR